MGARCKRSRSTTVPAHSPITFVVRSAGCCGKKDEKKKPKVPRKCTDVLCLIVFFAFLGVLGFICALAFYAGDWAALVYSQDYTGKRCGIGENSGKPKAFYPRVARDLLEQNDVVTTGSFWELKLYALCVDECPQSSVEDLVFINDYGYDPKTATTQAFMPYTGALIQGSTLSWLSATPTVDIANRCIPRSEYDTDSESVCAYPKCDSAEAVAVGAVCLNTTEFDKGQWKVCPGGASESGSGATVDCPAQEDTCLIREKLASVRTHEIYTQGADSSALLASVTDITGGIFEIMSSISAATSFILIGGIVLPVFFAFVYMLFLFLFAKTVIYGLLILLIIVECAPRAAA